MDRCIRRFTVTDDEYDGDPKTALAALRNGKQFLSAFYSRSDDVSIIRLWDIDTGDCLRKYKIEKSTCNIVKQLMVLDDDESFACSTRHAIFQFDLMSKDCGSFRTPCFIRQMVKPCFIRQMVKLDSQRIAILVRNDSGFNWCKLIVWNVETHKRTQSPLPDNVYSAEALGNDRLLLLSHHEFVSTKVLIWNIGTKNAEKQWSSNRTIKQMSLVDAETMLYMTHSNRSMYGYKLKLAKINTGERLCSFRGLYSCLAYTVPMNDKHFLVVSERHINMLNISTGKKIASFCGDEQVTSVTRVDDRRFLSFERDGEILLWDNSNWIALKHVILVRELVRQGRAKWSRVTKRARTLRAQPGRNVLGANSLWQKVVVDAPDEIFRNVVSYLER